MRTIFVLMLFVGLAYAQGIPQAGTDPGAAGPDEIPVFLPGGEQAGPTLPSQRGIGPVFSNNRLMRIRPYVGINAIYDTGIAPLATDADGNLVRRNLYGGILSFGAVGSRAYRRSLLNLRYAGNIRHYPQSTFLTATNHRFSLGFNHALSQKWTFNSANRAGILTNAFMGAFGLPLDEDDDIDDLEEEPFDNRVIFLTTNQSVTYRKSVRTSFTGGGGAFSRQRRSRALASINGVNALGSVAYRTSARSTIGGTYFFNQFNFSGAYGGTNMHSASLEFGHQLSPRTQLSLNVGGSRIESQSLQRVALDPILASLLGRPDGVEATYRLNHLPTFGASISHRRNSWNLNAGARRRVNPGNGLILTNMRTSYRGGVSYTGIDRWTFRASGGYTQMQGLFGATRRFENYNARIGMTYRIGGGLTWTSGVMARRFIVDESRAMNPLFQRTQYRLQTGLRWSPSDVPVPFF
jgi:hypothetical protein